MNHGICIECGKPTKYVNKIRGYRKTCSKECHAVINRKRFQLLSDVAAKNNVAKSIAYVEHNKDTWIQLYTNNNLTIREIAEKTGDKLGAIRKFLSDNGYTKLYGKLKHSILKRHAENLKYVHLKLDDIDWVNQRIKLGYTGKQFADELGCSADHITDYLRNKGRSIPRRPESSCEIQFKNWLKSVGVGFRSNDRNIIKPYELDIVIDSHKLAIEINGIYWHSHKSNKDKNYHKFKTDECKRAGYNLIQLHDADMFTPKYKNLILSKLNIGQRKIAARKCVISILDSKEFKEFCDNYHIQNSCNSKIKIGLRDKASKELLSVMSFSKSRFTKHTYEMIRYCNKENTHIIGGAQKMFSYFVKNYMNDGETCVSYCDRRLFSGTVYEKLGFKHSHDSAPGYYWINNNGNVLSRYQTQKHKLHTTYTESEYMTQMKYHKIYDCGQSVYVYINKVYAS